MMFAHAQRVDARRADGCDLRRINIAACASATSTAPGRRRKLQQGRAEHAVPGHLHVRRRSARLPAVVHRRQPRQRQGIESALAYAIAGKLNYSRDDVRWVRVPFNAALAPGPKTFDANLSEFSITEPRKAAVDFSSPYFDVTQAVVTVKTSPAAGAKSLEALRSLRTGAQVGTTSHTAAAALDGSVPVEAYNTNADVGAEHRRDRCVGGGPADRVRGGQRTSWRNHGRPIPKWLRRCRTIRDCAGQGQSTHPMCVVGRRRVSRGRHARPARAPMADRCR